MYMSEPGLRGSLCGSNSLCDSPPLLFTTSLASPATSEDRWMLFHTRTYTFDHPVHPMQAPLPPADMAREPVRSSPAPSWSHGASEQPSRAQDTSLAPRAFFNSETTNNPLDPPGEAPASKGFHVFSQRGHKRAKDRGNVSTRNPKQVGHTRLSPCLCLWQTLLVDPQCLH